MQIAFSVYFLGLAFAPLLVAPLQTTQTIFRPYISDNGWYVIWNALCPIGNLKALMILGRFMAASGASVGVTLTDPAMADMYRSKDRGKSLSIASLLPYLGPALGPIVGGVISQYIHWHWLFWILSIFNTFITLLGFFFISETYTPKFLQRKARKASLAPSSNKPTQSPLVRLLAPLRCICTGIYHSVSLLLRRPLIQLISFWFGLNFGIYILTLSTFASLFADVYHHSPTASSLHYLSFVIGSTLATQLGGPLMDYLFKHLQHRYGTPRPEFRAPFMLIGVLLTPDGLLWFGWAAQKRAHWALVDAGAVVFAVREFVYAQGLLAYLLDEYIDDAASANAASRVLGQGFGFAFPIYGPVVYERLGYGWGNTVLAACFIGLGMYGPSILWFWGVRLRATVWGEGKV